MPSNKTFVVLIVSIALIVSVWLFQKKPEAVDVVGINTVPRETVVTENDWQKILNESAVGDTSVVSVVPKAEDLFVNDTTITSQISKDLLAQYLLTINQKGGISGDDMNSIVSNILAVPEYNNSTGAKYISANLHINSKNDKATVGEYKEILNTLLKEVSARIKTDPIAISILAIQDEDDSVLKRIDPLIVEANLLIRRLLEMQVPSSAVTQHLRVLNFMSSVQGSLVSMRNSVDDPINGLNGINKYKELMQTERLNVINVLNSYFIQKVGSPLSY